MQEVKRAWWAALTKADEHAYFARSNAFTLEVLQEYFYPYNAL